MIWEKNQWHIKCLVIYLMVAWSSLKLFSGMCWWLSLLMCTIMNLCVKLVLHISSAHSPSFFSTIHKKKKIKWKCDLKADHRAAVKNVFKLFVQTDCVCAQFVCVARNCQQISITSSNYNHMQWQQEVCVCLKEDLLTQYLCLQSLGPPLSSLTKTCARTHTHKTPTHLSFVIRVLALYSHIC